MFKWEKGGVRPVIADKDNIDLTDKDEIVICPKDDLLKMIGEVNRKGCKSMYEDEPVYEEEHINKAVLQYSYTGAWQDFFSILAHNGYEVTAQVVDDEIVITWKDKVE